MGSIFNDFKKWISNRRIIWEEYGLVIDSIADASHAHQIHVDLHSKVGFGHIGFFESNNIYWVEFEAVIEGAENFYKYYEFDKLPSFNIIEEEYLCFMTGNKINCDL